MNSTTNIIEVQNLSKSYGGRSAIKNLSFQVMRGSIVGFLGPNGAGKSTTMRILTGSLAPDSGQVTLDGIDIFSEPLKAKTKIGYLPEIPPLYSDMTVQNFLSYAAKIKGIKSAFIKSHVDEAMEKTKITSVSSRLIDHLSKGYRQRVGIAQALVAKPEILILDEPTVGLDPQQLHEIRELISSLRGKHTVLLSTHILSEVEATCDQIIIINKGSIVRQGSLSDVKSALDSRAKKVNISFRKPRADLDFLKPLLIQSQLVETHEDIQTWELSYDAKKTNLSEISQLFFSQHGSLEAFVPLHQHLEDVFIQLTQDKEPS